MASIDSFNAKSPLQVGGKSYEIYRLDALAQAGLDVASLPYSLKLLLENLLRTENGTDITADAIQARAHWEANADPRRRHSVEQGRRVSGRARHGGRHIIKQKTHNNNTTNTNI